ncbi:MAG: hypothetical protein LBD62_00760 [Candidatus Margulisbacteria bacterium]|jgi:hypothetical protein|nr:hypothetical protein [Candidatus Margulisiibacteriota bacterium]
MDKEKFAALMPVITADLIQTIIAKDNLPPTTALQRLYHSKLYAALDNEATKVWQYSTEKLFALFSAEQNSGELILPEY